MDKAKQEAESEHSSLSRGGERRERMKMIPFVLLALPQILWPFLHRNWTSAIYTELFS